MDVNDHVVSIRTSYPIKPLIDSLQANPTSWDWNTTKIVYIQKCDERESATHEIAFVNLADCSPVTSTYQRVSSMDRSFVQAYFESLGPTIKYCSFLSG